MENIPNQLPAIMKALGDENRLKILSMLESGSLCACNMQANLGISQSTLSHHMAILSEAGLVSAWSVGKWTHYRLCPQGLELAQNFLARLQASAALTPETPFHGSARNQALEDSSQLSPACACTTEAISEARPETSTKPRLEIEKSIA